MGDLIARGMASSAKDGILNVRDFGAKGDGITDDTVAIQTAINKANSNGNVLFFPSGSYIFSQQLTFPYGVVKGSGIGQTILKCTAQLGSGVSAIILPNNNAKGVPSTTVRDMTIQGPGSYSLGNKVANCDGIRMDGSVKLDCVRVEYFDSGIIVNCNHTALLNVNSANNYYNLYFLVDSGDNSFIDCVFNGANFAAIGATGSSTQVSIAGAIFIRCHIGFSPYGIYGETRSTSASMQLLQEVIFDDVRFEQIGNGAIYTPSYTSTVGSGISNCYFRSIGFDWSTNNQYQLSGQTHDYAVEVGFCDGINEYYSSTNPFTAGAVGIWYSGSNNARWIGDFDWGDLKTGGAGYPAAVIPRNAVAHQMGGKTSGLIWYTEYAESGSLSVPSLRPVRKIVCFFNAYVNSSGTADQLNFPQNFQSYTNNPSVIFNNTGLSTSQFTLGTQNLQINPGSGIATPFTGYLIILGF